MSTGEGAHAAGQLQHAHRLPRRAGRRRSIRASARSSPRNSARWSSRCRTSSPSAAAVTAPASSAPKHQPLIVNDPDRGVEDLRPVVAGGQFDKRVGLLEEMEQAFHREYQADAINDHKTTYYRAVALMQSKEAKAFDLSQESSSAKAAYGTGSFGEGCLMARRLVEVGVPFVEVTLGGWDTHQDNFDRRQEHAVPPGRYGDLAALITDLKSRGLLDSTLVIWMGEFGRTPNINARGAKPGRDHYPRAWSLAMFGGGIKGGTVIGKTDKEGAAVTEGKTSAIDFMATVCKLMGIDYTKQNETPPTGRSASWTRAPSRLTRLLLKACGRAS